MNASGLADFDVDADAPIETIGVDPVEEIRLRTWARKNYAPAPERDETWHPIVLDEMSRKDRELI